ncbi:MAG: hypothetical protein RLZZ293_1528 [Pseudomonadota bacterium]|jgi:magnesium and cobalt transporter
MKLFNQIQQLFQAPINTRQQLLTILHEAAKTHIFESESLPLIEALLQFGDMRVKDIVLPRHEVDVIKSTSSIYEISQLISQTGHSRFPVIGDGINDILGVFHSKDIIPHLLQPKQFDLQALLRPALFVPELKPLGALLYEMRIKHSHLAIVVDEFTNVVGIITLEMIVEQIVGEIDDEYDSIGYDEHVIVELNTNGFRVKGFCGLEQFNQLTKLNWQDSKVESVGGYISKYLGRIPNVGEVINLHDCTIEIIQADSRKINLLTINLKNK